MILHYNKAKNKKLQDQLIEEKKLLREEKEKTESIALENEKKLFEEREKLRENITKMVQKYFVKQAFDKINTTISSIVL